MADNIIPGVGIVHDQLIEVCFSVQTFWNMPNHTVKTTAYQVYIYLNFENKSYRVPR